MAAPRTILRTTASWVDSFDAVTDLVGLTAESRLWVPGPLTSTMNLFALVHAGHVGARRVERPRAATHAVLTPSALDAVLDASPADRELGDATVVVAGDRLSPALHDRAVTAGLRVHHYYGAAELSFVAWGAHAEALCPFPGVEVEVRDGEIWAASPYLCDGYGGGHGGPLRRDPRGFATVGDRGDLTDDGRLEVHGRDGAVTTAGATVQVAEVEQVLRAAAEGEVVVLGLPHHSLGQVLVAVLTAEADRPALTARARALLSPAGRPRAWLHVARLPLTEAGKVDRAALAERLGSWHGDGTPPGEIGPPPCRP